MQKEIISWTLIVPRSLKNELTKMAIDEGTSVGKFCKPEIDNFLASLVSKIDRVLATRAKQQEEAQIVAEHPMIVTGKPVENRISNTNEENN